MAQEPIASVFNDAYAAEQFEAYRQDPTSVEESWRQFFRFAEEAIGRRAGGDEAYARIAAAASRYTAAIRSYGHLAVQLDPLGSPPPGAQELHPEFHRITEDELTQVSGAALGFPHLATAHDVAERLKKRYTRNLAVEVHHIGSEEERVWFRSAGVVQVLRAEIGDGENFGEDHLFAVGVDFALDLEGRETIALELAEFVERSVGAAFLQGSEFDEAFHL